MRKEPRTTAPTAPQRKRDTSMAYQLPEEEYHALMRTRDHARLLACLSEPRSLSEPPEVPVSLLALTNCFQRLADDLDAILREAWWPGDHRAR